MEPYPVVESEVGIHTWFGYLITLCLRRYGYFLWYLLALERFLPGNIAAIPNLLITRRTAVSEVWYPLLSAEPPVISYWAAQKCPPSRLLPDSSTGKPDLDGLHASRLFPESLIPPVVPQAQPLP